MQVVSFGEKKTNKKNKQTKKQTNKKNKPKNKTKQKQTSLLCAEFAQRVVKMKDVDSVFGNNIILKWCTNIYFRPVSLFFLGMYENTT